MIINTSSFFCKQFCNINIFFMYNSVCLFNLAISTPLLPISYWQYVHIIVLRNHPRLCTMMSSCAPSPSISPPCQALLSGLQTFIDHPSPIPPPSSTYSPLHHHSFSWAQASTSPPDFIRSPPIHHLITNEKEEDPICSPIDGFRTLASPYRSNPSLF